MGIKDLGGNIKEWFQQRGDDITGLDRSFQDLIYNNLLPRENMDIYKKLEDKDEKAEKTQERARQNLDYATETRRTYKEELDSKEAIFKEKYGKLGGVLSRYNLPLPIIGAFSPNGKEYHRLKREIKMAKRNYKFWTRCSDENYNIFVASEENRKIRRRALAEYKRIIVKKSKQYKKEFQFVKEYNKLRDVDANKLEHSFGPEIKNAIAAYKDMVREDWFKTNGIKSNFDLKKVKNIFIKLRRGEKITDEDTRVMEAIVNKTKNPSTPNNPSNSNNQNKPNKSKQTMNLKPPVDYQKYNLDRRAVEVIARKSKIANITPEEFLIIMKMSYQYYQKNPHAGRLPLYMKAAAQALEDSKRNDPDDTKRKNAAAKGAEILEGMVTNTIPAGEFKSYVEAYQKALEQIKAYHKDPNQSSQTR